MIATASSRWWAFALRAQRALPLCAVFLVSAVASADGAKDPPWEKFDEADGISVFRREVAGSPIIALRGEGVVNAPILRVASVLVDSARAPEWIDKLAEVKVLRKISDDEFIHWNHIATPVILKDRDFVFDIKLSLDAPNKKVMLNYHSVYDSGAPKTDFVRGEFKDGAFVLTSIEGGKKTLVMAQVLADPKGSVAKWIVNMFQKSWAHNTIASLRKQVAKPDIKDQARLKDLLSQQGY